MLINRNTLRSCEELLLEFKNLNFKDNSSSLTFTGTEADKDVYNITAPFLFEGSLYIAGRVEARAEEHSRAVFFRQENESWRADPTIPALTLQDPFVTTIDGLYVVGGVEIFEDEENPGHLNYRTIFYKGSSLRTLERFANGPDKMKDIRLCQLEDGRILVMTRPQGTEVVNDRIKVGGRGTIGYTVIQSLDELTADRIRGAELLEHQFIPEEWGGCNELFLLKNGKIGVLSHIARYDGAGDRHYYSTAFCFDCQTGEYSPMKMIAVRANFQDGPSKRPDLKDVIFSGGLIRKEDGKAELYCGVSDTEGHRIVIDDPFLPYEV